MATIEGAQTVGLGDEVDSAEAGQQKVKTVMVGGRVPVRDGQGLTADTGAIRTEAQVQAEEVARCVAADPVRRRMALRETMEAGKQ